MGIRSIFDVLDASPHPTHVLLAEMETSHLDSRTTAVADCIENAIHMHPLTLPSNVPLWVSISGWVFRYKWGVAALIVVCCLIREAQRGLQARHRP